MTDQANSAFAQQRQLQQQRNVRTFNTPKSPVKMEQSPSSIAKIETTDALTNLLNNENKDTKSYLKSELEDRMPKAATTLANTIQQPEILKVPTTPTKNNKSVQPKTPLKLFNRRERFSSSEESSPLKRMREGSTSNYAADHEAEMERLGKRFQDFAPPCDCMNSSQQACKYICHCFIYIYIYIHIYMHVCMCIYIMFVCYLFFGGLKIQN